MRRTGVPATLAICAALLLLAACKANDGAGGARSDSSSTTANANRSSVAVNADNAPATTTTAQTAPADGVRRISVADARSAVDKGEAVFIDVRSKAEFDRGHIKGALSFPKSDVPTRAAELPHDKLIIAYCA